MSKINLKNKTANLNIEKLTVEKNVMGKIKLNQIKMKPKWLFLMGSIFTMGGLIGLTVVTIFLTNLTIFLIRKRGPGYGKLELMFESFSWWVPVLAVLGIVFGILMLRRYEFSYKKNFLLIILLFITAVIIGGLLVDQLGLNTVWSHQGPMRRFYQQIEGSESIFPDRSGGGMMRNGVGKSN